MNKSKLLVILYLLFSSIPGASFAASVDGLDIHYTSEGSGPTIIFVHGWTCDLSSWRDQVPVFAREYQVLSLDLPGHGTSDSPAQGDFSMALFARAVEAVREEAGSEQIVLVGHSMGVPVIKQYALLFPEHVSGLVAVDGPFDMSDFSQRVSAFPEMTDEVRENMIRGMFVPSTPESLQAHILSMMLGAAQSTANGAAAAMFDPSIRTDDIIKSPAMAVIAGTGSMPDMTSMKALMPNFTATQMEGTGHFLMMEQATKFNTLLDDFLTRIDY